MIYHGIVCHFDELIGKGVGKTQYGDAEYARFQRWGLNAVHVVAAWGKTLEPEEMKPYAYNQPYVDIFKEQVELMHNHNLKVLIGFQNSFKQSAPFPQGWTDKYGGDYINLNQKDASGNLGRDRYLAFLRYIARELPDVGIGLWNFPYHNEGKKTEDLSRLEQLHGDTLPLLYQSVREVTKADIVLNPALQGQSGDWVTGIGDGQFLDLANRNFYQIICDLDADFYFGFSNHGRQSNFKICCKCQKWDYKYDKIESDFAPLVAFKQKHPNARFCCIESHAMNIHPEGDEACPERPIDQTRLDWAEALFKKMQKEGLGWFWHSFRRAGTGSSPTEKDGSDTTVADLISKWCKL